MASITHEDICVVVNEVKSWLVELGRLVHLRNGKTNCVREALTKRAGGDLNSLGLVGLRVAWGDAVDALSLVNTGLGKPKSYGTYSEGLEVIEGDSIPGKMKKGILKRTCVAVTGMRLDLVSTLLAFNVRPNLFNGADFSSIFKIWPN